MARPIRNNSKRGQLVYDSFLGSGTTMVAALQMERICYGMEIAPLHCQTIVNRMLQQAPDLVLKLKR